MHDKQLRDLSGIKCKDADDEFFLVLLVRTSRSATLLQAWLLSDACGTRLFYRSDKTPQVSPTWA